MKPLTNHTKAELIGMIEARDRALTSQKHAYDSSVQTLRQQIEKLRAQTTDDRIASLEAEVEKLQEDLTDAKTEADDATKELRELQASSRRELRELQEKYDEMDDAACGLRGQLEEAETKDNDVLSALVETCGILLPAGETPDESLDIYNLRRAHHDARVILGVA